MSESAVTACCAGLYELPLTRLLLGSSFHPGGVALTDRLAHSVALGPGDRVLDLASGRGDTALHLARTYGVQVVGVDYSAVQVAESNERARAAGLAHSVFFIEGNAEALPLQDESFDVVFCECALCTFPSRQAALKEVRRVLVPSGSFALSDVVLNHEVPEALQNALGHVLCVSGALARIGYEAALEEAEFSRVKFRDASETLMQLIDQIDTRIRRWRSWPEGTSEVSAGDLASLGGAEEVAFTLKAAREFVVSGGIGYATFSARCPRP